LTSGDQRPNQSDPVASGEVPAIGAEPATRELEKAEAVIQVAEDATAVGIRTGWLVRGEHPQWCLQRRQNKHEGAVAAERTHKAAADSADSALDLATADIERLDDELSAAPAPHQPAASSP